MRDLLFCEDCKAEFKRAETYMMQTHRTDPLYKWKTKKCDDCVEIRVNQSLKALPAVMKALAT